MFFFFYVSFIQSELYKMYSKFGNLFEKTLLAMSINIINEVANQYEIKEFYSKKTEISK